ncbi:MAG: efflux RND transporter permease subunit [Myxococcota bacterium]|nr:efflux RND transporter permease subunit [Myxococcota bacterium]
MFSLVVSRPVATWMIAIAIAVFGMVSYGRLPLNLMPDLSYPSVTVRTEVPGYAPEEVESQISRPIEEAIATTQGLAELESRSRAGVSDVVLEFRWGTDMNRATQDIRERLQTTFLPADASRPLILRYDPSMDPIMRIALSMEPGTSRLSDEGQLFLLRDLAVQEIQRELEAMDGVAAVSVRGGLEREILVEPREDWLAARGLTIDQLINTLGAENVNIPGGSIRDGDHEYLVRTLNQLGSLDEIRSLQITRSDGVRVPISEVATVRESFREREVISRLDAVEAVEIEVFKAADANIVSVATEIEASIAEDIRPDLPDGVRLTVLENQAGFIEASINNLRSTAVLGALLAVVVLFLFLRDFRSTAIIGAAIPLSIVCTFAPMYLGGVSLNLMSLGGLALGVGMLVDNAVVVLENIQVHIEAGKPRRQAAVDGTAEVAAAVIASTLTTISVFAPIAFVEGIAGQIFSDLSLAVVFSLLASLAVALFFVPMLAAAELTPPAVRTPLRQIANASRFDSIGMLKNAWRGGDPRRLLKLPWWVARSLLRLLFELMVTLIVVPAALLGRGAMWLGQAVLPRVGGALMWAAGRFQARYSTLEQHYGSVIQPALARPATVMGIAAASVLLAIPLGGSLSQALIPEVHQGRFAVEVALPVGTPLPATAAVVRRMEQAAAEHPEIENVHAIIGSERRADSRPDEGEHTAKLMVELTPGGNLARREGAVMSALRTDLLALTEGDRPVDLRLSRPSLFSFRTPIEVVFYGTDLDQLRTAADDSVRRIGQLAGITDVRSSLMPGYPEIRIVYDRDLLRRYNLNTATVASRVREKIQGEEATAISQGDVRVDLVVRLEEAERRSVQQLKRLNINPNVNPPIPLESVASFIESEGPSEIRRVDQRRAAVVSANLDGFDLSGQAEAIAASLQGAQVAGIEWELTGQNAEMERSSSSLKMALGLAIFLVYVIMASTFESILHPFVILFSVPLALVGVVGTLWVTGVPVSVVVLIGAIVLAGVVVNNAIVLVDTINRKRADGLERIPAVEAAARLRLRPILITTTTTVLGLLPLALGIGEGAEIQMPLALTVIAGLSSSTLLTLVVIPVVYLLLTGLFETTPAMVEE